MPREVNLEAVGIKRNEENEFKENRFSAVALCSATFYGAEVTRIFRPARNSRGNTNLIPVQHVDDASWIWATTNRPVMHRFAVLRVCGVLRERRS